MEARIESLEKPAADDVRAGQACRSSRLGPSANRRSTGSRTSATSSSHNDEWKPNISNLRGWAQFGCSSGQKLQKHEAIETYNQIATFFDPELQEALAPTPPFLLNHAQKLERLLAEKNFTIKGAAVRARCEQSPGR